jgi:hypothetical protein
MYVHLVIHHPKPDKASLLIDSMHRFGTAMQGQPGLVSVHTLQDQATGALVGLALWASQDAMLAARPLMAQAVANDPFDEWEDGDPQGYALESV